MAAAADCDVGHSDLGGIDSCWVVSPDTLILGQKEMFYFLVRKDLWLPIRKICQIICLFGWRFSPNPMWPGGWTKPGRQSLALSYHPNSCHFLFDSTPIYFGFLDGKYVVTAADSFLGSILGCLFD